MSKEELYLLNKINSVSERIDFCISMSKLEQKNAEIANMNDDYDDYEESWAIVFGLEEEADRLKHELYLLESELKAMYE